MRTLLELKRAALELDPYDVVKPEMDGFDCYPICDFGELEDEVYQLSDQETDEWSDFAEEYLQNLQDFGARETIKRMKEDLYVESSADPLMKTYYHDETLRAMKHLLSSTQDQTARAEIQRCIAEREAELKRKS